jgi:hypothetical protein
MKRARCRSPRNSPILEVASGFRVADAGLKAGATTRDQDSTQDWGKSHDADRNPSLYVLRMLSVKGRESLLSRGSPLYAL